MNRLFSSKSFVVSAIALGAVIAGSAAHAQTAVTLVVGLNSPHRYVQPAPVLVQPAPLVAQNRGWRDADRGWRDADRDGIPNKFDRDSRFFNPRATQRQVGWADFDRDGVPNRFDRAPRNPRRY